MTKPLLVGIGALIGGWLALEADEQAMRLAVQAKIVEVGKPRQITVEGKCLNFRWAPDGKRLVFLWQPFTQPQKEASPPLADLRVWEKGRTRLLTRQPNIEMSFNSSWFFTQKGKAVCLFRTLPPSEPALPNEPPPPSPTQLLLVPLSGGAEKVLFTFNSSLVQPWPSFGGSYLLLQVGQPNTPTKAFYLLDPNTLHLTRLLEGDWRLYAWWEPGEKGFFLTKREGDERLFYRYEINTRRLEPSSLQEVKDALETFEKLDSPLNPLKNKGLELETLRFSPPAPPKAEPPYGHWQSLGALWLRSNQTKGDQFRYVSLAFDLPRGDMRGVDLPPYAIAPDGGAVAYINYQSQLFMVPLQWRPPETPEEKIACGVPLSEAEQRQHYVNNARKIGVALRMYVQDYDLNFPPADNIAEGLDPYLKNKTLFLNPETGEFVFHYLANGQALGSIADPAQFKIGYLDSGRGYVIVIYADGHVEVQTKP